MLLRRRSIKRAFGFTGFGKTRPSFNNKKKGDKITQQAFAYRFYIIIPAPC